MTLQDVRPVTDIQAAELEITGTCNLHCLHCCTDSGPGTPAGSMTRDDWLQVLDDLAALRIPTVQLIGGEPTLSPHLPHLVARAAANGLDIEVYSNLTHVSEDLWALFERYRVRLATSYYAADPAEHDRVTMGRGSHRQTRVNIIKALERGLSLRVGIVRVNDGQDIERAVQDLRSLGVKTIHTDDARPYGRAAGGAELTPDHLCGRCFHSRLSISPNGQVSGCILSRHMTAGNIRTRPLAQILTGPTWQAHRDAIPARGEACPPDDSGDCDPANTPACDPAYEQFAPRTPPHGDAA